MMRNVAAYLRERFRFRLFGPATLLFTVLATASMDRSSPGRGVAVAALVVMLLLQFRLWDDLEDRDRDAAAHPERVLVRLPPGPFWQALWLIGAANLGVLAAARAPGALGGLLALDIAALAAYRAGRIVISERAWTHVVLLAKYPAIVAVAALAGGAVNWDRLVAASLVAFATAHVYERVHTRAESPGVSP